MQKEATDEFVRIEAHLPPAVPLPVVLVGEANPAAVDAHDPVVRDGDAMSVAPQVVEHL